MTRKRVVRVVATVALVAAFALSLRGQWDDVGDRIGELSLLAVLGAVALVALGVGCSLQSWRVLLAGLGSPLPLRPAARVFFIGQLGKYLPGSVWPVLTQMELAKDHDVPRRRTATATLLAIAVGVASALLVALGALPWMGDAARPYRWALLALPVLLVVLHPPVLTWLLNRVLRLARRDPLETGVRRGPLLAAIGWTVVSWLFHGLATWLLVGDLGGTGGETAALAVGGFSLAWAAGFLVLVAPGGLGVREGALVVLLRGSLGTPAATLVALAMRLVVMLVDAGLAALGAALGRGRARKE